MTSVAHLALLSLFISCSLTLVLQATPSFTPSGHFSPEKSEAEPSAIATMAGSVDDQNSQYVLIDGRNPAPIANLVADGFPQEGFAKHMGHKAPVPVAPANGGSRPGFKVRSVEAVSDTRAPQQYR